jgi:FKBP-type peptidyl-prolyl cis-trans isomerase 2
VLHLSNFIKICSAKCERLVPCRPAFERLLRFPTCFGSTDVRNCGEHYFIIDTKKLIMQQAQNGDKVKVNYHGKLRSGETFDSSEGREPLEFTVGSGQVIKGFDEGVKGMNVGDKRTVEINVEDAYGEKNEEMIIEFEKDQFPPDMNPEVGMQLMMNNGSGQSFPVTITEVRDESVLLDANHPLAGQDLIFDIELVEIVPTSKIIMPR